MDEKASSEKSIQFLSSGAALRDTWKYSDTHIRTVYSRGKKGLHCYCSRFERQDQNQTHTSSQCYANVFFPKSIHVTVLLEETCSMQESRKMHLRKQTCLTPVEFQDPARRFEELLQLCDTIPGYCLGQHFSKRLLFLRQTKNKEKWRRARYTILKNFHDSVQGPALLLWCFM